MTVRSLKQEAVGREGQRDGSLVPHEAGTENRPLSCGGLTESKEYWEYADELANLYALYTKIR